ncbi:thioredoxin domain-containing protein [Patescibacteria group bacterium]|nr:thioredoxin domain-containing protein [Patescibacteria group bacterium]
MHETREPKGFFEGNPKMIFIFGLVSGIVVTVLFSGGIDLPKIGSPNPTSDVVRTFEADDGGNSGVQRVELAPVTGDEHIRGDLEKAKVVLVEYSDFECPFCSRHHPTMKSLLDEFGDDVAWVYRHFPLTSIHPQAQPAALATECAAEQEKFWEFADAMFENKGGLGDDLYTQVAGDIGLDVDQFTECYESEKYADAVAEDVASGSAAGVSGTPATFVNGQLVSGAVPYDTLKAIVEAEIGG